MRRSNVMVSGAALLVLLVFSSIAAAATPTRVPLRVERAQADAPVTFGIPMPKGALDNPDHVRVLDASQREIPSQITDVSTWEPIDPSIKWIWVFFFTTSSSREYTLEFGPVSYTHLTLPTILRV